jgi:hypothetical protein
MANMPAYVSVFRDLEPLNPKQLDLFPSVPPRLVRLDSAPVLFSALTHAEYEPAGFLARLPRTEGKE